MASTSSPSPATHKVGDGFSPEEVQVTLQPLEVAWQPPDDYADCEIHKLLPGPRAVTFMGRVANLSDVAHTRKTAKSAQGCVKLCVRDNKAAITIRLWYVHHLPKVSLGALVSVWTNHISNGENTNLSSSRAPLFASLFPERDRSCHLMVHENSDDGSLYTTPLGFHEGRPLSGLMTLQNFVDGGAEVDDAKILVIVKSVGAKKKISRKDGSVTENINVQVHDDTAVGTLGLWGICTSAPLGEPSRSNSDIPIEETETSVWKAGDTVLLLHAAGLRSSHGTYLTISSRTLVDINPTIPDAAWLRTWSQRQSRREAINPAFPSGLFDFHAIKSGPVRCLFTLAELDEFARVAPRDNFQGYLSLLITEVKLVECWKKRLLFNGQCCETAVYANATSAACRVCNHIVDLRLNPHIVGQVMDETAVLAAGTLIFSDKAWRDLLGRGPLDLLRLGAEEMRYLADRLLFCRITVMFGWAGEDSRIGGRVCVLGLC